MAMRDNKSKEIIYLSIVEELDLGTRNELMDKKYSYPDRAFISSYCLRKIFQTDPDIFTGITKEEKEDISKGLDQGKCPPANMFGQSEFFSSFEGNGDKVAKALCDIFSDASLFRVSEQLTADSFLEAWHHATDKKYAASRHFVLSIKEGAKDYIKQSAPEWTKAWYKR